MRIDLGAKVFTADGQEVGKIDRFIVDPRSNRVQEFVVRKGLLIEHDILIPVDWIDNRVRNHDDNVVYLHKTAEAVSQLPEFTEANYAVAPDGLYPDVFVAGPYTYAGDGWLWPAPVYEPATGSSGSSAKQPADAGGDTLILPGMLDDALQEARPNSVILSPGTDVKTHDGEKVGTVDELVIDPKRGKVTEIIIRKGLINHKEIRIPTQFIEGIDDDAIHVALDKNLLEQFTVNV